MRLGQDPGTISQAVKFLNEVLHRLYWFCRDTSPGQSLEEMRSVILAGRGLLQPEFGGDQQKKCP
jgi:hypothetical protein